MAIKQDLARAAMGVLMVAALAACDTFDRDRQASEARRRMVGLSKEEVLACMGPPKQKAQVGATEVWAYSSTNGLGTSLGVKDKINSEYSAFPSMHQRYFCTVNVVMRNDVVSVVHYNGPRGGLMNPDEQCGFAIEHCVE